ncbi:uncharacterized protein [Misgurnus anguillicaudatus]|uniref:uncharacterized protein isoform X2 n=1 Tax=Misgurnus anguillicaudatus TaxID=75329 RepID=UPI003CCFBDE0
MRLQIMDEVQKSQQNLRLIEMLMQKTFALRRQEIIQENPHVKDFLEKWPALRIESQFYAVLDQHTAGLVALYRQKAARTGKISEVLRDILKVYDLQEVRDVNMKRTLALRALPVYLREDDPQFFKTLNVEESDETGIIDTPVALVTAVTDDTADAVHFSPANISIVVEDSVVMSDIPNLAICIILFLFEMYTWCSKS